MKLSCIKPTSKVRGLSIEPRVPAQVALINACITKYAHVHVHAQYTRTWPWSHILTHALTCIRMRGTVLLVGRSITFLQLMVAYQLADSLKVSQWLATLLDSTRKSILAMSFNFWCLQGTRS